MFQLRPPDGSRDPRIEDPSNRWVVHLSGRLLLGPAIRWQVSANLVSFAGLGFGAAGAYCYLGWPSSGWAFLGFISCVAWLIADGLDGMIARATGSTSALGRFLDGACDHLVFVLLYLALAWSTSSWVLAAVAGFAHAMQATLYEGERARFHRRIAGDPAPRPDTSQHRNVLIRVYDAVAFSLDRWARRFDLLLERSDDSKALGKAYGEAASPALKAMWVLSNNMRVVLIYLSCVAGNPRIFWWIELGPLSLVALLGIVAHRRAENRLVKAHRGSVQGWN